MKKWIVGVAVTVALAAAGVASAALPQGYMSGDADLNLGVTNIVHLGVNLAITDGEQVYLNKNNDPSGDCDGDTGRFVLYYSGSQDPVLAPITCAHMSNAAFVQIATGMTIQANMSISFRDPMAPEGSGREWVVLRVLDRATNDGFPNDKVEYSLTGSESAARDAVNLGVASCHGCVPAMTSAVMSHALFNDYQISPSFSWLAP